MIKVPLKPLSVNQAYTGKRFSTPEKNKFTKACDALIRAGKVPDGKLRVDFEFGVSNKAQDVDGPIKVCLDVMQKRFDFNDNRVYELTARKVIVTKGQEYWAFEITAICEEK